MGSEQDLILSIIEEVLAVPRESPDFPWLNNYHSSDHCGKRLEVIDNIFRSLGGSSEGLREKQKRNLSGHVDAWFPEPFNFIVEVDEEQHFTEYRSRSLQMYPSEAKVGFSIEAYLSYCERYGILADRKAGKPGYRKPTKDFPVTGRMAQRAYLDTMKDLLPPLWGLWPTVRIATFELLEEHFTPDYILRSGRQSIHKVDRVKLKRTLANVLSRALLRIGHVSARDQLIND